MVFKIATTIISSLVTIAIVASVVMYIIRESGHYDLIPEEGRDIYEKAEEVTKQGLKAGWTHAAPHVRPYLEELLETPTVAATAVPAKVASSNHVVLAVVLILVAILVAAFVMVGLIYMNVVALPQIPLFNRVRPYLHNAEHDIFSHA